MPNPAYLILKRAVEGAIPDLSLNEAPHLIINEKTINILLDYDTQIIKKAMAMIKRNYPKYHFEYLYETNLVKVTIFRKSYYNLIN